MKILALTFLFLGGLHIAAQAETVVNIAIFRVDVKHGYPLSRLDLPVEDLGFAGADIGLADNQTTGNFLGLTFNGEKTAGDGDTILKAFDLAYQQGIRLFVVAAPAEILTTLADKYGDALIFNTRAHDNALRNAECRANMLHIAPSQSMLTDGLAQYLMWKKWGKWFLIHGSHPNDHELANSYRKSAEKFRAEIVEEREFADTGGARRTDTGHVLVQKQIPVFTQDAASHDVVVVADANDLFAAYLPYRTWEPRPVTGSAGLIAETWDGSVEAWGATQFQRRFEKQARRYAREEDYQDWLAVRVIGEAVVRTKGSNPAELREFLLGKQFEIAAFKGEKLSFRDWDGQMRQPVLLSDTRLLVSVSPQEGYLHQYSQLDTLGTDRLESDCKKFRR